MTAKVPITVNGEQFEASSGTSILELLRGLGIHVPTLCHDDRLTPYGGCRLCLVERRDGRGGLLPACSTPVQRGMVIETDTTEVIEARRRQLQLLVLDHRMECPVCEKNGDCRLQDLVFEYGVSDQVLPFERRRVPLDDRSPVIVRDPEKCILCGLCVRLCDEVQGVAEVGIVNRGLEARVATLLDRPLDCEFCGQCVNSCPVGALSARPYHSEVPAWLRTRATTTCSLCSCGCQVTVETHDGAVQRVTSNIEAAPNYGKLCAKGWLGWDALSSPQRLTVPLVRRDGRLVDATWDEALGEVERAMAEARASGQAVVAVGSSRLACEDAYLLQRLVRAGLASPHVGVGPVGGVEALVEGMGRGLGVARSTATFGDLREADLVLVLRADPTRTHPLVKNELVQGARQRGRDFILVHDLSGGLERHAAMFLSPVVGTEDVVMRAVAAWIAEHSGRSQGDLAAGLSDWTPSIRAYGLEVASRLTGVAPEQIEALAERLLAAKAPMAVVVTGLGIPGDETQVTRAAIELLSLLGGGNGAVPKVMVLGEKANVQGVLNVGLHPDLLPGGRRAGDSQAAAALEATWGVSAAAGPGWSPADVREHTAAGETELLYLVGEDPVGSWPRRLGGRAMVRGARFVVVQGGFLTESARMADVVLPVAILGEREGTVVGADGCPRRLTPVLQPPAGLPQDGSIFAELGRRLGVELPSGQRLVDEVGAALADAEGQPAVRLAAVPPPAGGPPPTGMLLDASPRLFHSGLVTGFSPTLQELAPTVALHLAPSDAEAIGVHNGERVCVRAGGREILLRARLDRRVRPGRPVAQWYGGEDAAARLVESSAEPTVVEIRRSK
ncbi:MAG: molybdopterin-dependent oxidoreductase [Acidobacteria bacterium]|jgi:predicted molibdopterin-dependent oxidoreductase YjgC|nr:molybdopterin-dependent oxidoreductase [Acidobacteriota bacterium]